MGAGLLPASSLPGRLQQSPKGQCSSVVCRCSSIQPLVAKSAKRVRKMNCHVVPAGCKAWYWLEISLLLLCAAFRNPEFANTPFLNHDDMRIFEQWLLPEAEDPQLMHLRQPNLAQDVSGLPPALILTAEFGGYCCGPLAASQSGALLCLLLAGGCD